MAERVILSDLPEGTRVLIPAVVEAYYPYEDCVILRVDRGDSSMIAETVYTASKTRVILDEVDDA